MADLWQNFFLCRINEVPNFGEQTYCEVVDGQYEVNDHFYDETEEIPGKQRSLEGYIEVAQAMNDHSN